MGGPLRAADRRQGAARLGARTGESAGGSGERASSQSHDRRGAFPSQSCADGRAGRRARSGIAGGGGTAPAAVERQGETDRSRDRRDREADYFRQQRSS